MRSLPSLRSLLQSLNSLPALVTHWNELQAIRFLVIGGVNTLIGYLNFTILYLLCRNVLHYLLIAVLSHAISACVAYYLQRRIVFRSKAPWFPEFIRFNASMIFILVIGLSGLYLCVTVMGMHPLIGQALVTILSVIGSYIAHHNFSFQSGKNLD